MLEDTDFEFPKKERGSGCSVTMLQPIFPTTHILPLRCDQKTKTMWFPILYFTFIYRVSFFISKSFPQKTRINIPPQIKSFTFVIISNHRRRKKKEGDEDDE